MKIFIACLVILLVVLGLYVLNSTKVFNVSLHEFEQQLENDVQLLDVRTPQEWAKGTIDKAIRINFYDKDFKENVLTRLTKDKPVYIYCKTGGRSTKACKLLLKQGFKVYNVEGGYNAWRNHKDLD